MSARQLVGTALLIVAAVGCGGAGSGPVSFSGKKGVETSSFNLTVRGETAVLDPSTNTTIILPGGGLITSNSGGIDCGIAGTTLHKVCAASFPYGTTGIVLTAVPDAGSGFQYYGFAGACGVGTCSVDITSDRLVVVRFAKTQAGLGSHPNFTDPAVHVPVYRDFVAGISGALQCAACHGANLQGQGIAVACSSCHAQPTVLLNAAIVGSAGGSVTLGSGPTISVGAGVLPGATTLSVAVATSYPPLPSDAEFLGTVYEFGPSGGTFSPPVTVIFPIPLGVTNPTVFWGNVSGTGFDELGGVIVGNTIQVQVSHFTPGGVGRHKTYVVGGTVSGLTGTGLVLQNKDGDDLPVLGAGTFAFPTRLANGAVYSVTVARQPMNPAQTCMVANPVGTISGGNVTTITVTCYPAELVPVGLDGTPGQTSVVLIWTTGIPSTSAVYWDDSLALANVTPVDNNLVTDHTVAVGGLRPNTAYLFEAVSMDDLGRTAVSPPIVFITTP
jgi:hypothetical protein